jgi:hypothetical protein
MARPVPPGGAKSFLTETVSRVRDAGASGQLTIRADSAFYSRAGLGPAVQLGVEFSDQNELHDVPAGSSARLGLPCVTSLNWPAPTAATSVRLGSHGPDRFSVALGELRSTVGMHVGVLVYLFNMTISEELATNVPPLPDDGPWEPGFDPRG